MKKDEYLKMALDSFNSGKDGVEFKGKLNTEKTKAFVER